MRVTKVLSNILGMKSVRVLGCEFEEHGLVIDVGLHRSARMTRVCSREVDQGMIAIS